MRDKTASKTFRAKKKLDHLLAARRARRQDRFVYGSLAVVVLIAALVIIRLTV